MKDYHFAHYIFIYREIMKLESKSFAIDQLYQVAVVGGFLVVFLNISQ